MTIMQLHPDATLELPAVDILDQLCARALVSVAERAAALHAGALARLAMLGTTRTEAVADESLTAEEVAQRLKAEPSWVYRHQRQLGGIKLDGILRFSRRGLETYLERRRRSST